MLVCVSCGANFPVQIVVEGRERKLSLHGRKQCLECRPHRPLRKPRKSVAHPPKSLVCLACGEEFPAKMVIDGKMRSLYRRRFCLECSPFGDHNTSKTPPGVRSTEDAVKARRERRREQFRRALRKKRRERKSDLVAAYGGRCIDCGYSTCPDALQFHHRDPSTKDFGLGNFSGSLARYAAEAAKCDLVCANCHRIRHAREISVSRYRMVELRRETKRRAIVSFGGACLACRSVYAPAALEFHHPDASKKEFAISDDGIYRSWEKVQRELENCVMLCANCHAEIHAGLRDSNLALPAALERPTVAAS